MEWEWNQFSDLPDSYGIFELSDISFDFEWEWHHFSDLPNCYGECEEWFYSMVETISKYLKFRYKDSESFYKRAYEKLTFEVEMIHRRWELISCETKVLDVASCPDERIMLALLLEDKRLRVWWNIDRQYERVYLPAVKDLHNRFYEHCSQLVADMYVGRDGDELEV